MKTKDVLVPDNENGKRRKDLNLGRDSQDINDDDNDSDESDSDNSEIEMEF